MLSFVQIFISVNSGAGGRRFLLESNCFKHWPNEISVCEHVCKAFKLFFKVDGTLFLILVNVVARGGRCGDWGCGGGDGMSERDIGWQRNIVFGKMWVDLKMGRVYGGRWLLWRLWGKVWKWW